MCIRDRKREDAIRAKHDAACGADLPDAVCPKCGAKFAKEGFNIPFEDVYKRQSMRWATPTT